MLGESSAAAAKERENRQWWWWAWPFSIHIAPRKSYALSFCKLVSIYVWWDII